MWRVDVFDSHKSLERGVKLRSFFAPETKSDKPIQTKDHKRGHRRSARPGPGVQTPEIQRFGRAAASSLAAAVCPRSAGRVFPRSPPFLASCGGCGLPRPRCAGRVFPRSPSFVRCGRRLRFAAPSPAAVFPRSRFFGGRPAVGVFFSRPGPAALARLGRAWHIALAWRRAPFGPSVPS